MDAHQIVRLKMDLFVQEILQTVKQFVEMDWSKVMSNVTIQTLLMEKDALAHVN